MQGKDRSMRCTMGNYPPDEKIYQWKIKIHHLKMFDTVDAHMGEGVMGIIIKQKKSYQ